MAKCILCGANATYNQQESASRSIYNCPNCGIYLLSDLVEKDAKANASKLAAYFTSRKLAGNSDIVLVSFEQAKKDKDYLQLTVNQIVSLYPHSFSEQIDMILKNLVHLSAYAGAEIKVEGLEMAPVFYLEHVNYDALSFIIKYMHTLELIDVNYYGNSFFPCGIIISPKGWDRISQMHVGDVVQNNVMLVYPQSDDEISSLFCKVARKVSKQRGYHIYESSAANSDNLINHEMIAMIKESQFVICDLSTSFGAAYYAMGMASALGTTQIVTCHNEMRKKLQIDTEQINVLGWSDEEDLYFKILNSIRAQS